MSLADQAGGRPDLAAEALDFGTLGSIQESWQVRLIMLNSEIALLLGCATLTGFTEYLRCDIAPLVAGKTEALPARCKSPGRRILAQANSSLADEQLGVLQRAYLRSRAAA